MSWDSAENPLETCRALTIIKSIIQRCILLVMLKNSFTLWIRQRSAQGRLTVKNLVRTWTLNVLCGTIREFLSLFPLTVFTCFLWISEQTAIISLYCINWLVFVTKTECVYCAVRAERLTVIHVTFHLEMVRPWLRSPASHREGLGSITSQSIWDVWWTKWRWDEAFSEYFCFPCQYRSTNVYLCVAHTKTNGRSLGTSQKSVLFRKSWSIVPKCTMAVF
jgi:hypothetical protein